MEMETTGESEEVGAEEVMVSHFSAGSVLRLTFSVFGKNPLLYLVLAFLAEAPKMLLNFLSEERSGRVAGSSLAVLISVIFTGAIAYGVYKGLIGERAGFGEAVSRGLSRFFSLFGISIVLGILMIFLVIVAVLLQSVGMIIAAVVVMYYTCVYVIATPACVVERLGPLKSLNRSAELTKGHRWSVFGLLVVTGVVMLIVGTAMGFTVAFVPGSRHVFEYAITPVITALTQVGVSVLYYQLRSSKEGVSVSSLARVFE